MMPTGTPAFTRSCMAALRSEFFMSRASAPLARQAMHQQYLGAPGLSNKAAKSSQRAFSTLWKASFAADLPGRLAVTPGRRAIEQEDRRQPRRRGKEDRDKEHHRQSEID